MTARPAGFDDASAAADLARIVRRHEHGPADLCCLPGAWQRVQAMGEVGFRYHVPLPEAVIEVAAATGVDPHELDWHVEAEHGWEPHDPGYADRVAEAAVCIQEGSPCGTAGPVAPSS